MSIEKLLQDHLEALNANTTAIVALTAALLGEADKDAAEEKAPAKGGRPPKETAAAKKKREAAERKAAEEAENAEEVEDEGEDENEMVPARKSVALKTLKKTLGDWLDCEDEDEAEDREEKLIAGLAHLGADRITDLDADDRIKVACYADNWIAGNDVDFEEIDAVIDGEDTPPAKSEKKTRKSALS